MMTNVISVRLDDEVNNKLTMLSKTTKSSRPNLIANAIQAYLNEHQEYLQAIEESIQEVEAGMSMSHDEVKLYWKNYFEQSDAN